MQSKDSALTPEILEKLTQGTKIEFSCQTGTIYKSRIEINHLGEIYFTLEGNYKENVLIKKEKRFEFSMDNFFEFSYFKIIVDKTICGAEDTNHCPYESAGGDCNYQFKCNNKI